MTSGGRLKKTSITRSKNGCVPCRRKRRKCDEGTPSCRRCVDTGTECDYNTVLEFVDATSWAARRVKRDRAVKAASRGNQPQIQSARRSADLMWRRTAASSGGHEARLGAQAEHQDSGLVNPLHQTSNPVSVGQDGQLLEQDAIPGPEILLPNHAVDLWHQPFDVSRPPYWQFGNLLDGCSEYQFSTYLLPMPYDEQSDLVLLGDSPLGQCQMAVDHELGDNPQDTSHIISQQKSQRGTTSLSDFALDTTSFTSMTPTTTDSDAPSTTPCPSQNTAASETSTSPPPQLEAQTMRRRFFASLPSPRRLPCAPLLVQDRQYLAHFQVDVVDILPLRMHLFQEIAGDITQVRFAMMAVAAANLANCRGEYLPHGPKAWQAQKRHLDRAVTFATEAMVPMTTDTGDGLLLGAEILVFLLLTCYSLEAGTVLDVQQALGSVDKAILGRVDDVLELPHGESLIKAWLRLRIMVNSSLRPQVPVLPESTVDAAVAEVAARMSPSSPHAASLHGVNALRISQRILAARSMVRGKEPEAKMLSRLDNWWSVVRGEYPTVVNNPPLSEQDLFTALSDLNDQLELLSPPQGFPPNFDPYARIEASAAQALSEPLHFSTHEEAMDAADFCFAKLACDTELVRGLLHPCFVPTDTNSWFYLLLRIACGLDPCSSIHQNKYRLGIARHLTNASLLCNNITGLDVLTAYIHNGFGSGSPCEDFFTPFPLTLWGADVQRREMEQGRVVFFLSSTFTTLAEKSVLYAQEPDECMMVFGREANGRHFNDVVPWYDSTTTPGPDFGVCF